MIPTWTPVGTFGVRRTQSSGSGAWNGRGAVVADGGFVGQVAQDEHRIDQVVPALGEHGAHVRRRTAAA